MERSAWIIGVCCDVALERPQGWRDGFRIGAGSRAGGSSSEDRDNGVQPGGKRDYRHGIEVQIVSTLSPSDGTCRIWDVNSTKEITSLQVNEIQLQEMKWDFTGSLLCTGMKNREYQIWDARTSSVVTKWEVAPFSPPERQGHASPRRSYMAWLGDSYYLVTTGYSRRSNREVILRDIRNIDAPVHTITADNVATRFLRAYRVPGPSCPSTTPAATCCGTRAAATRS